MNMEFRKSRRFPIVLPQILKLVLFAVPGLILFTFCGKTEISKDAMYFTGSEEHSYVENTSQPTDSYIADSGFIEVYLDEDVSGIRAIRRKTTPSYNAGHPQVTVTESLPPLSSTKYDQFHSDIWLKRMEEKYAPSHLPCTDSNIEVPGFSMPETFWIDRLFKVPDLNLDETEDIVTISVRRNDLWLYLSVFLSDGNGYRFAYSSKMSGTCQNTAVPTVEVLPYPDAPDRRYIRIETIDHRWSDGAYMNDIYLIMFPAEELGFER